VVEPISRIVLDSDCVPAFAVTATLGR